MGYSMDNFFECSLDLNCIAGPEGFFKKVNRAWSLVLGWKEEELLGRPYLDFVHVDDQKNTMEQASRLIEGRQVINFENRYRCRDGSYRRLAWMAVSESGIWYATARDITKEYELKSQIAAKELLWRTLLKFIPTAVFITDLEGNCTYVNEAWQIITGFPQSRAKDLGWLEILVPNSNRNFREVWKTEMKKYGLFRTTVRIRTVKKQELPLNFASIEVKSNDGIHIACINSMMPYGLAQSEP